ncbi:unnamed protein product, partial [marine sediment metagenome]
LKIEPGHEDARKYLGILTKSGDDRVRIGCESAAADNQNDVKMKQVRKEDIAPKLSEQMYKNIQPLIKNGKHEDARKYLGILTKSGDDRVRIGCESAAADNQNDTSKEIHSEKYLVSAIVSTYNSERFIRGCIEDLEGQTINDKLEIIVVNSGSEQNEEAIVKELQKKYSNIKYIKNELRETVYAAWNRGLKAASGKYITNANTDDRHRKNAFEVMVNVLEALPEIALVYA